MNPFALLQRYTPAKKRRAGKRRGRVTSARYLAWIRTQPCLVEDLDSLCSGAVQAHHHGHNGQARANDFAAVPLCAAHHTAGSGPDAVHGIGKDSFEERFQVSFDAAIARLNREWEGRRR